MGLHTKGAIAPGIVRIARATAKYPNSPYKYPDEGGREARSREGRRSISRAQPVRRLTGFRMCGWGGA